MSLEKDIKSVLAELSPILAGFKLAVIVIGYFGLGSVAKWIISYWYPFTRWVWDEVAILLSFPEFPIIVKDSLTALIFFLPLGITAVLQRIRGENNNTARDRFWGGLFGFLFLFLICKDVISSVANSIATSMQAANETRGNEVDGLLLTAIVISYLVAGICLYKLVERAKKYPIDGPSFFSKIHYLYNKQRVWIKEKRLKFLLANIVFVAFGFLTTTFELINRSGANDASAIIGAMSILAFIVSSLMLAIYYVPKKLFITTGAAIAFVLAAIFFEGFIGAKEFMESVATTSNV
jgi:hypothetical protein